jgi:hypothetical protein
MSCRRMLTEALVFLPHALARLATLSRPSPQGSGPGYRLMTHMDALRGGIRAARDRCCWLLNVEVLLVLVRISRAKVHIGKGQATPFGIGVSQQ